jgi:hypothetical protein
MDGFYLYKNLHKNDISNISLVKIFAAKSKERKGKILISE